MIGLESDLIPKNGLVLVTVWPHPFVPDLQRSVSVFKTRLVAVVRRDVRHEWQP